MLRPATIDDLPGVEALLARSYPRLLATAYPPSTLVMALPLIARAQPALLTGGTYSVLEAEDGTILAAGGWTVRGPQGDSVPGTAHVRHVVSDPDHLRAGNARRVLHHVFAEARAAGAERLDCLSTLNAVPFYMRMGFQRLRPETIVLRPGITFDAVAMRRPL